MTGTRAALPLVSLMLLVACGESSTTPTVAFEVPEWSGSWYKGNTHAHTVLSGHGDTYRNSRPSRGR